MLDKRLEDIAIGDIRTLAENNVLERKTLEYKAALPGNKEGDKKEFLADVSSFANTVGGDLVFGVRESNGVVCSEIGMHVNDTDAETARLENMIRDGVSPRIPVEIHTIDCEEGKTVIILRMRASLEAPHRVTYSGHDKFYRRNSNGKYPMDVGELRTSFLQSGEIVERIRRFREVRVANIRAGEAPLPVMSTDRFIAIHIVPLSAFSTTFRLPPEAVANMNRGGEESFRPFPRAEGWSHQINLEGVVVYTPNDKGSWYYTQLYRDGKIEAYDSLRLVSAAGRKEKVIPMFDVEADVLRHVKNMRDLLDKLGFNPPYHVFISLVGVRDLTVPTNMFEHTVPIRRAELLLPEMVLEQSDDTIHKVAAKMRTAFELVWNAAGVSESPYFKEALDKGKQAAG